MANFHVLAMRNLGREQKKKERGEGERAKRNLLSPSLFFLLSPNFRTAKTSEFATETLATQAKSLLVPELYRAIPSSVGNTILG